MDISREDVEPLLDEIDFLCRSANRVVVLDALTEGPLERYELEERTGVSRPTLGRVLADFEERNWISRNDREYRTTPVGEFLVESLTTFLEQMVTARTLAPVMRWVPPDGFDFDVTMLRDSELVVATEDDPMAPLRRVDSWIHSGDRVRLASYGITTAVLDAMWRATVEGDQELVAIFTPGVYDTIEREPEMLTALRQLLAEDAAEFYVYRGDKPELVAHVDGTAGIGLTDDGILRAVLLSDDEGVVEWADGLLENYRDQSEPFEPTPFLE